MKKIVVVLLFLAFLTGCAQYRPTTKRVWMARMLAQEQAAIDQTIRDCPEALYCFDANKKDLRYDLGLAWNYCVNDISAYLPDVIHPVDAGPYGEEIAFCVLEYYYTEHKEHFTYENLPKDKQKKCKEFQREAEVYVK